MDLKLKGARVLVTGATKGIGRAIAETFAAEGANVAICARNANEIEQSLRVLQAAGIKAWGAALDVGNGDGLKKWVNDAAAALGGIDVVVSNVSALAIGAGEDPWQLEFNVDMMGAVRLVETAMPYLEKSKQAAIVTISSVSGREIDFAAGAYGAMKAAIIHYTQGLAYQLAGKGIRANTVSPGNTYFPGGIWQNIQNTMPDLFKQAMALNPTHRMATPQEIANAVVFLASPASSYTTGTNLVVDGALTRGVQF